MSFKWTIGDELTAARLNQVNTATDNRLTPIEHNVLQLFLENYFSSKFTPFQGLFFDGFSDSVKTGSTTDVTVDTGNKRLILDATFKVGNWVSILSAFQSAKEAVRVWIVRNFSAQFNLDSAIAVTDITLDILGAAGKFAIGNTIDISDQDNLVRERKTLTDVTDPVPIAFDAVANHTDLVAKATFSWNHTVIDNTNGIVFVTISQNLNASTDTVTSATYGGSPMTLISGPVRNGRVNLSTYYFLAPSVGSSTISITFSGATGFFAGGSVSYTGVNQSTPIGTPATNTGSSTAPSVNVSSALGELVVDGVNYTNNSAETVGAGQIQRVDANDGVNFAVVSSEEEGAGTVTMSWSLAVSTGWGTIGVALKPAVSQITVLEFTPAIINAGGFGTTAFVERVDVIPQVSLVDSGAGDSFQDMTFIKSIVDFTNSEVEDEYEFVAGTPQEDFKVKLNLSREDVNLTVLAKRLGAVLTDP